MNSLLLAVALASPGFSGFVAADGGAGVSTEGLGPDSTGARIAGRIGFAVQFDAIDYVCELQGGWAYFPEDGDGRRASGFDVGSGVRLGVRVFDVRTALFGHLGVDGLFQTRLERLDDQLGRRTRTTTRDDVGLGADAGLAITYVGLSSVGIGVHGMWQTTLAIDNRRERLTAGLHVEVQL